MGDNKKLDSSAGQDGPQMSDNQGQLTESVRAALESAIGAVKGAKPALDAIAEETAEQARRFLQIWAEQVEKADKEIDAFLSTDTWTELKTLFPDAVQWMEKAREGNPPFAAEIVAAFPGMMPELRSYAEGLTTPRALADLIPYDELGLAELDPNGQFNTLIGAANERMERDRADISRIQVRNRLDKIDFPLDKVNSSIWTYFKAETGGQLAIAMEPHGSSRQLDLIYSIDFDEIEGAGLQITKKLDAFDKRVYLAAASMYAYKGDTMTLTQIYNAMGYDGTPGRPDRERINNSLTKMQRAHITMDNKSEADALKNYDYFRYDGYLLPFERVTVIANGKLSDSAIHLLREPPLYSFAKNRKQITTVRRCVLQSPLNKTNVNIALEDYLIERIAKARGGNKNAQKRILYVTIFEKADITTKQMRSKCKPRIIQLLDHYKETGFIAGYTTDKDGITLKF